MDFLVNNIWLVLIFLFVIWLFDKLMNRFSDKRNGADHFQKEMHFNEKIHAMEHGDFTDEDLKLLLPNQRVLAVQLVKEKYAMGLGDAQAYVARVEASIGSDRVNSSLTLQNQDANKNRLDLSKSKLEDKLD